MLYVDMVEIFLGLAQASREGDWMMHLHFIEAMLPWCFAYDKQNYARYLSVYYGQMTQLQEKHPYVHSFMQHGGFSVQIGHHNTFGRIPVDQTIEETVNKDTQTAGGTKGFSLKPAAICKYYLTAEYRSMCIKQLRIMIQLQDKNTSLVDHQQSRIKKRRGRC